MVCLRRIDETGQRTEVLLRTAAERMEAAETVLQEQINKEGLANEADADQNTEID